MRKSVGSSSIRLATASTLQRQERARYGRSGKRSYEGLVNLGDDADTIGAIAGGLAGLYYGYEKIPEEWLQAVVKREKLEEICWRADMFIKA